MLQSSNPQDQAHQLWVLPRLNQSQELKLLLAQLLLIQYPQLLKFIGLCCQPIWKVAKTFSRPSSSLPTLKLERNQAGLTNILLKNKLLLLLLNNSEPTPSLGAQLIPLLTLWLLMILPTRMSLRTHLLNLQMSINLRVMFASSFAVGLSPLFPNSRW